MQSAAYADVLRDCGLGAEYFGDDYGCTEISDAYSTNQGLYADDPISEFTDDLDYSPPLPVESPDVPILAGHQPISPTRSAYMHQLIGLDNQQDPRYEDFVHHPSHIQGRFSASVPRQYERVPELHQSENAFYEPTFPQNRELIQRNQHQDGPSQSIGPRPGPARGSDPPNSSRTRLRPVSEMPDMYRGIFKFGVFNAVQSTCFETVMHSDENLVISAPTGSGKTVLFELAIIRMLTQKSPPSGAAKCVYMAPTKALCSERYRDWSAKFDALGVKCCELTGDTVQFGRSAWGDARNASIIITTGEKWDSLTRNWSEHNQVLDQIHLFLVDEVHILNDSRGSTLEVVVSRMKFRGSDVRFALVSATVPNIHDIANWIGNPNSDQPATVFQFGEEFRPCKLTRHVYGIHRAKNQNDFMFARSLDYHLYPALMRHSANKPILIFVSTRKGTIDTAEKLAKVYQEASEKRESLPWSRPTRINLEFKEKRLKDLAICGIGVHHAGLSMDDRRSVENLYLKGILKVVVATSTLAVGVNLPAHTVVLKGVHVFQNNASVEYSDLEVMQMLGRAGRPQFDKDGVAIILCESNLEPKYQSLVQGKTVLESSLHLNLSEHLNSEIGLGTISSVDSAKEWLQKSFLFQRIKQNPNHYALGKDDSQSWVERIGELVIKSVADLQKTNLVEYTAEDSTGLRSTEFGDIMSKFYIRLNTMSLILSLPTRASMRDMLEVISSSEELAETKLRISEKRIYNTLRKHDDIRFEVKKVETTADKVLLLIQAVLGGISFNAPEYQSPDSQPHLDAFNVFRHIPRIARAMVEVAVVRRIGSQLKHGLELGAWEDRPVVLRQIEQIGEKSLKVLASSGITSIKILRKQDPIRIETLLNRRPPFGLDVLASAHELPTYALKIAEAELDSKGGKSPVEVTMTIECSLLADKTVIPRAKKQKSRGINMTSILTLTSDMDFIDYRRIQTKALVSPKVFEITAQLTKPSQSIVVHVSSESVAGVTVSSTYKPKLDPREYPTLDTRPGPRADLDLQGFDEVDLADFEDENIPLKDLTKDNHAKEATKPTVLSMSSSTPVLPKMRPNGNQECNHPCKDKQKCRHLCCRDGVAISDVKKRGSSSSKDGQTRHNRRAENRKPGSNRHLQEMEALHQITNVQGNLKLEEGRRLKVESHGKFKGHRTTPNFNIKLTDFHNDDLAVENSDSDSEPMPEPSEIAQSSKPKLSSDYGLSSSDMDNLIRNLPSEPIKAPESSPLPRVVSPSVPKKHRVHSKRSGDVSNVDRSTKRLKTSSPDEGRASLTRSPSHQDCVQVYPVSRDVNVDHIFLSVGKGSGNKDRAVPLFLVDSLDSIGSWDDPAMPQPNPENSAGDADITLEDNLMDFDSFYTSVTSTSTAGISAEIGVPSGISSTSHQHSDYHAPARRDNATALDTAGLLDQVYKDDVNDDLADLESWLLSGEVEIVSKLQ